MNKEWNEDDYDAMSENDCCEHGVGFDEDCECCDDDAPVPCSVCFCWI